MTALVRRGCSAGDRKIKWARKRGYRTPAVIFVDFLDFRREIRNERKPVGVVLAGQDPDRLVRLRLLFFALGAFGLVAVEALFAHARRQNFVGGLVERLGN
jgi:hypothetical protein